jgi:mannose-1-phosphate guanylyltransferase
MQDMLREDVYKYGAVRTDAEGYILQSQEKPDPVEAVATTINTSIYVFEPQVFDYIRQARPKTSAADWFARRLLARDPNYAGRRVRGLLPARSRHRQRAASGINVRMGRGRVRLSGPIYIGNKFDLGQDTVIEGPTAIGSGCVIEPGAEMRECLIGD